MQPTQEQWLPVVGHEGLYEVSNHGQVRSAISGSTRKPQSQRHGHLKVVLCNRGNRHGSYVHALVLTAFVGARPDGLVCRHLDGDPANNAVENLSWGTASENKYDQGRHGTDHHGAKTHCDAGHPFNAENTYVYRQYAGSGFGRGCRECRREGVRRYRASKRAYREAA